MHSIIRCDSVPLPTSRLWCTRTKRMSFMRKPLPLSSVDVVVLLLEAALGTDIDLLFFEHAGGFIWPQRWAKVRCSPALFS